MNGKIVSVSLDQGVGIIAPDEEGGELSFRSAALHGIALDDLTEGMDVEFLLGQEAGARPSDGLRVVDVRPAEAKVAVAADDETPPA